MAAAATARPYPRHAHRLPSQTMRPALRALLAAAVLWMGPCSFRGAPSTLAVASWDFAIQPQKSATAHPATRALAQAQQPRVGAVPVCVATEYYCGVADNLLDGAYSALAAHNCTQDSGRTDHISRQGFTSESLGYAPACSHTQAQATHCAPVFPDFSAWTCGSHVIDDATYQSFQQFQGECQPACVDSSAASALPSQYYWSVSNWTACTNPCEGGLQTRQIACMNSVDGTYAP